MDDDAYIKITMYLNDNGEEVDDNKVKLMKDNEGMRISKWEYVVKEPTAEDLNAYTVEQVNEEKEKVKNQSMCSCVLVVSGPNKLKKPMEGDMIYNTTTNQLQVYVNKSWVSFDRVV